jgi:GTP-binding protein HflX
MMQSIEVEPAGTERAILVGLFRGVQARAAEEESITELAELVQSAGGEVVDRFLQGKERPDPAHVVGRGKLDEVGRFVKAHEADLVVFDCELSPAQLRNLEAALDCKVLDRSELILDIFSQRAHSSEGKLQVELAQLEYLLPRLAGKGQALSRLGGGIGTRGPGETKLETDRRAIRTRIARIKLELTQLEKRRALHRARRKGKPILSVSLVGYTNAGKSTLFNRISSAETFADPKMFATLDPLVRRVALPSGQEVLLTDTVGFIRKLPHSLVAAFHATLEETLESDLIVHVIDVSHPSLVELRTAVYEVLHEIGVSDQPVMEVYNKLDQLPSIPRLESEHPHTVVSAKTGEGIREFLERLEAELSRRFKPVRLFIPFDRQEVVSYLRSSSKIESLEYREEGIYVVAFLSPADLGRYQEFM